MILLLLIVSRRSADASRPVWGLALPMTTRSRMHEILLILKQLATSSRYTLSYGYCSSRAP